MLIIMIIIYTNNSYNKIITYSNTQVCLKKKTFNTCPGESEEHF